MTSDRNSLLAAVLILAVMGALMMRPIWEESATVDEPVFLGAGYSYWMGHRYYLNCEHPPLVQLWSAVPLLFLPIQTAPKTEFYFDQRHPLNQASTWDYYGEPFETLFPRGFNFYYYPLFEARYFGDWLVYGGNNNSDRLLLWGRLMQVLLTLAIGAMVFLWAKSLSNAIGGLFALITWAFNPISLGYGHLVITDPGIALMLPLTVWLFSRFLDFPSVLRATIAGVALGGALLTKFTAVILLPICGLLIVHAGWRRGAVVEFRAWLAQVVRGVVVCALAAWSVVLLMYVPSWNPPPPISVEEARAIKVPGWFQAFRLVLIPREYFKGLAIVLAHTARGHGSYLLGRWSPTGWWYYFPLAICFKTPLALLLLFGLGLLLAGRRAFQTSFMELSPLIAALVYLGCSMASNIDIGIRHVLPMFPLLGVFAGAQIAQAGRKIRLVAWGLSGGLVLTALLAHPFYIEYFNELAGGSANGYRYLADSNLDWGQEAKRLKVLLDERHIQHVYMDCFIPTITRSHLNIQYTDVDGASARLLTNAVVVVSASRLVRPEWSWLRERHQPTACIANSIFLYQLP